MLQARRSRAAGCERPGQDAAQHLVPFGNGRSPTDRITREGTVRYPGGPSAFRMTAGTGTVGSVRGSSNPPIRDAAENCQTTKACDARAMLLLRSSRISHGRIRTINSDRAVPALEIKATVKVSSTNHHSTTVTGI